MSRRACPLGSLFIFLAAATVAAIDLDISPADIEAALKLARGSASARAAFHARYAFPSNHPTVERIDIHQAPGTSLYRTRCAYAS